MITLASLLFLLQETESETPESAPSWWTSLSYGEWVGKDFLIWIALVLFLGIIAYAIYSAAVYSVIGSNRHPANFRKFILAGFILFSFVAFSAVFKEAFGGVLLILLFVVWGILALVLWFTKRRLSQA